MNGHPLIEWRKIKQSVRLVWAESFGIVVAFVIGILIGIIYKQEDIMDDCKYAGTFRIHSQAYNCQRKI